MAQRYAFDPNAEMPENARLAKQRELSEEYLAAKAEEMADQLRAGIESAEVSKWRKFLAKIRRALEKFLPREKLNELDDRTLTDLLQKSLANAGYQIDVDNGNVGNIGNVDGRVTGRADVSDRNRIDPIRIEALDIPVAETEKIKQFLFEHFRNKEVFIQYDGRPVVFLATGLEAGLKRRNEHRKSFSSLDKIVEGSIPVGYENVDKKHAEDRPDMRGQFIYASLVEISDRDGGKELYVATIKLDDVSVDRRARFKDISIKKIEDALSTVDPESLPNNPVRQSRNLRSEYTIQQIVESVKRDFNKISNFHAFDQRKPGRGSVSGDLSSDDWKNGTLAVEKMERKSDRSDNSDESDAERGGAFAKEGRGSAMAIDENGNYFPGPDEWGNIFADLSEVSFTNKGKIKESTKNPPHKPLAEVVETVARHQAAGSSPSTGININASDDLSSGDWKKSGRGSVDLAAQLDPALEDNMIEALLAPVKSANGDLAALLEGGALKYLTDNGFPDVGNNVARYLVMEARDRLNEIKLKQSRKHAFENFRQMDPLFDFIAEFAGNGENILINPGEKYVDSDVSGSFISPTWKKYAAKRPQGAKESDASYRKYLAKREMALAKVEGANLDEIARAYVQEYGGDEVEVEQKMFDLFGRCLYVQKGAAKHLQIGKDFLSRPRCISPLVSPRRGDESPRITDDGGHNSG